MAKQIVINKEDLPPIDANSGAYLIRYRLASEDRSSLSYWSPIYSLPISFTHTSTAVTINKLTGMLLVAWEAAEGISSYDVMTSWTTSSGTYDWKYYGRYNGTGLSIAIPSGKTYLSIRVYKPSQAPSTLNTNFLVAQTDDYYAL